MSDYQLFGWMQYAQVNPFSEQRADLRAGIVAAAVTNGIRAIAAGWSGKRDFQPVSPIDYLPFTDDKIRKARAQLQPTTDEQFDRFLAQCKAIGEGMNRGTVS